MINKKLISDIRYDLWGRFIEAECPCQLEEIKQAAYIAIDQLILDRLEDMELRKKEVVKDEFA